MFGLALFAVQAPLLGPRAFGLITIVMIFVGFCEFVLEIASTEGLVSVRDIDERHYATMTTANAAVAAVLGIAVFFVADWIAALFSEPELAAVLRWMAVLPLISALLSAPNAATRRAMQFRPLAIRSVVSIAIGGTVGLVLAILHYGVWALVAQAIVQRLLNVGILWAIVPIRFRLGFSLPHFRELMRYAGPMLVSQTMTWSAGQIPRFLLGFYLGAGELGLFSLASRLNEILLQLTLSPRYAVARMEMQRHIDDPAGLAYSVKHLLQNMAVLCFPMCIGGAALMPVLFSVWLDARWLPGIFTAQIMLLMCLPYVTHYGLSAALLGINKQSAIAVNSAVQTAVTVLVVAVFAPLGLNAAVSAIALRPFATAPLPMFYVHRYGGLSPRGIVSAQLPLLAAALVMGAVVAGLAYLCKARVPDLVTLPLLVVVGVGIYGALLCKFLPALAAPYLQRATKILQRLGYSRSADGGAG
jgi:O-antigen/teichoic acid export membrane protein